MATPKRARRLTILLTTLERAEVEAAASAARTSLSDWVRRALRAAAVRGD